MTEEAAATIELISAGSTALVNLIGMLDERFIGFGDIGPIATLVVNLEGLTRMTSFGVRQWLVAVKQLPGSLQHLYFINCPTFFVDQLNMVANLIGHGRVITSFAPYVCEQCGDEEVELIDVHVAHQTLLKAAPNRQCARCGGRKELDDAPEAYFAFCRELAAVELVPEAADLLAAQGRYVAVKRSRRPRSSTMRSPNPRALDEAPPASTNGLDAYEIIRRLATSPTADVFLATRTATGETIALKRFHMAAVAPGKDVLARAVRLGHPNVARVLEVIPTESAVALALEYIHGNDLRSVLEDLVARGAEMPLGDAVHVVREVARALVYARAAMPDAEVAPVLENVMLSVAGEVKLLGVGTASLSDATESPRSDVEFLRGMFEALAAGRPAPIVWPQRGTDVIDELGRVARDPALESSPHRIAELVAGTLSTHAPLVTDGANVKIAAEPVRGKRPTRASVQPPVRRPAALTAPAPLRTVPPQQKSNAGGVINAAIVVAILAIVVLGGYMILSKA